MSARTILKHVYENGGMTEYQFERIDRVLKERERPHGEWKPLGEPDDLGIHSWHICSSCGFRTTWHMVDIFHFCPNCGSDNRRRENNSSSMIINGKYSENVEYGTRIEIQEERGEKNERG